MSISFRILPARGLVYIRYDGVVRFPESEQAFSAYMRDPGMRRGQKQLIDLARVTAWDPDFAALMKLQAHKADAFVGVGHDTHFVYHAPDARTCEMAGVVLRSWDGVPGVVPLIQETEAGALHVLGQPEDTFDALLQNA